MVGGRNLPVQPRIGFEKALVAERAQEMHLADFIELGAR